MQQPCDIRLGDDAVKAAFVNNRQVMDTALSHVEEGFHGGGVRRHSHRVRGHNLPYWPRGTESDRQHPGAQIAVCNDTLELLLPVGNQQRRHPTFRHELSRVGDGGRRNRGEHISAG